MASSLTSAVQQDRAAGIVVGACAGDALGAAYEYGPRCAPDAVQVGTGALTGRPAGHWTDDGDMTVCVAKVAAEGHRLDGADGQVLVAEQFLRWYADRPPDVGGQTRAVLSATTDPRQLAASAAAFQQSHPDAAGNGSLARTGPVALAHLGDDDAISRAARAVSSLTHPHPLAGDACVLWSTAIDRAVREGRLDGIWEGVALIPSARRSFWETTLKDAETAAAMDLRANGDVVSTLQAAWHAIVSTTHETGSRHLEAALRAAVSMGGEADTVAAVAGALLGARHGASAVPFAWRRNLVGWPAGVGHRDLVAMGVLAARRGRPDHDGWPVADDLLGFYELTYPLVSVAVEIPGHPGVVWGNVAALGSADARSFVSLCRIGATQRRGDEHHEVWLVDGPDNADLPFVLADTADAIETLRAESGSVFVHCVKSASRTPAVATAWLVRHRGLKVDDALAEVRAAFRTCRPTPAMLSALETLTG